MPFFSGGENLLQLNQEGFDFNIQFEQLFFSIIPSAVFIVVSLWRMFSQARKPTVVNAPVFQLVKLAAITIYVALELSMLILAALGSFHVTRMFLAASILKLVSALTMITLSLVDHNKSPRPSVLLNSYLFLTLLLDAAQARTLFLSSDHKPELTYSRVFVAAVALKVGILLLEARPKSKWVSWDEKEHSPEETSGIFSLSVFSWLNKIFLQGYNKILMLKDLFPLDSALKSELLHREFSKNMDYSKLKGDKFGLFKVLVRTLTVPLLLPVFPRLALLGFTVSQPFFIESLLNHLSQPEIDANVGYGFIGASLLIYGGIAVSTALTWYFHHRMRTMARSILVTETFIAATRARIGAADDSAALTLMSTDIERIKMGFRTLHDVWAAILQVAIAAWMLNIRLGLVFLVPMGVVIVCCAFLAFILKYAGDSQRAWMSGVQKRVGLTATVITSMKNLKISGLSTAVRDYVQNLRVAELAGGARFRKIFIIAALAGFCPLLLGPPLTFAFAHHSLSTTKIFTSVSWLLLMTYPLQLLFSSAPELFSGLACIGRIQSFLECETCQDFRQVLADIRLNEKRTGLNESGLAQPQPNVAHPIVVQNGNFGWKPDEFVLRNINTRVSKSALTLVIGPVGSGKSTLCNALLGEIPFNKGSTILSTRYPRVGFCDQVAFLSNRSVRDNVVGFSSFDQQRYTEVIEATSLSFDIDTLPQGDMTIVGSDGITLSGGQKQRVSLARALYLQSDLLVLDDIFSGLDANTEEKVFRQVFGPDGLLRRRGSTVVLCTHSVRHLHAADHIIALVDGTIAEQGSFDQLMGHDGYVRGLGLKESTVDNSFEMAKPQSNESQAEPQVVKRTLTTEMTPLIEDQSASRQLGDKTVYKHYAKSMGLLPAAFCLFFAALWGFFTNFSTIWLKYWSDDSLKIDPVHSYAYYVGIYALIQLSALVSLLLLAIALLVVAVKRVGANLHRDALATLIRAPLRFFTTTDTGVVTNLFSQDLNLVDTELPDSLLNFLFCTFQALGQAAVMLSSSPYLAISYPFLAALLYIMQKFYLRTSRQLRLLDLETKSPLYTHFLDTVKGIVTLRAFGFLPDDIRKNARLIDSSQRPAYLLLMIQSWLTLVLDLVVMVMAVVLTTLAVRLHSNSGFAGASLVTLMSFGENLSGIVIYYTRLETSIGAIGRLRTFNETVKPEDRDEEDITPPERWPYSGEIELQGISASYNSEAQSTDTQNLALRDINLTIRAGEKIAICGRTGSGKSSLIALLLKLLDPLPNTPGEVTIDKISLYRIDRTMLRQRIIAVPQEPVFLPDGTTFQANLDPYDISTSEDCQAVLVTVGLWPFVQSRGGLQVGMSAGTFSVGQRGLFSLARAVLRRRLRSSSSTGGILLLDEVSSSVDTETERVMREILREEFTEYTIVSVSHRLDMVMGFDRVVVMELGRVVEVGNPKILAVEEGTRFGELVRAGGM